MLRLEKREFVVALEEVYSKSNSMIITHYHGLTVSQMTSLRKALKTQKAGFKVIKNTLSKIVVSKIGLDNVAHLFTGPTAIAYSADPIEMVKIIVSFSETNENLKIIGGVIDKKLLEADLIQQLAKLPSLNQIRGKIIGILQVPAVQIAILLQEPASKLARVLQAYSDKN